MSKIVDSVKFCAPCKYCHWEQKENRHYCFHPSRTDDIEIKDINKFLSDCPLPDWPEVTREKIKVFALFLQTSLRKTSEECLTDIFKEIGVKIVEKKKP